MGRLLSLLGIKKIQGVKKDKVGLKGELQIRHTRDGKVLREQIIKNIIVNAGKAEAAGLLNGEETTGPFTFLSIGVGATGELVTDTILDSEITTGGGSRAAATCSRVTTTVANDTAQMVKEWTFSASFSVVESGAFNHITPGTGEMLCRKTFSAYAVVSGDKLEVTWKVAVS